MAATKAAKRTTDKKRTLQVGEKCVLTFILNPYHNKPNNNNTKSISFDFLYNRVRRDEEIVCYADVGCFRDDGPFNYLDMLPSPPEEVSAKYPNCPELASVNKCL